MTYINSFIFLLYIFDIFGAVPVISVDNSQWYSFDTNSVRHVELSEFIRKTVSLHFSDCYGIKIYSQNGRGDAFNWKIPSILQTTDVDVDQFTINQFNSLVKFGKQCIVYEVHLNSKDYSDGLLNVFKSSESRRRAQDSYIFVNEYHNFGAAKKFLIEPRLKNYPSRVWPDIVNFYEPGDNMPLLGVTIHYSCLYCNGGMSSTNKVYRDAADIKNIKEIFPDVTSDLRGHTLKISAPPAPPLALITPSKLSNNYKIEGQQKNILYGIAGKFNFTCKLYPVPGGSTGSKLPNGTWTGVMGEILYERADIGLTVATAYDRREIADFTVSVFYAFLVLVSTKPIPVFTWQSIFYPFKTSTWLALIGATFITLYLYQFLHNRSLVMEVPARKIWKSKFMLLQQIKLEIMTGFRAFYMTVGTLLEQSSPVNYNTMPSRMIASFWMMFAIIITCAYRSKLFSFLMSPNIETPPSSFQELAGSDYTWGMKSLGGIALLFITQSPLHYIRNIGERMDIYTDKYSCLDKTFHGKFTCIIYKAYIDYMMEVRYWKLRHQFHVSDFVTPPVGSAWALVKHSPLKRHFDEMSYRIHEMGLADKYLNDYQVEFAKISRAHAQASNATEDTFNLNENYTNDDDNGPKPLEMANLYGGFFILGLGICLAITILLFEIVNKRHEISMNQKRRWKMIRTHIERNTAKHFPTFVRFIVPNLELKNPTIHIQVLESPRMGS